MDANNEREKTLNPKFFSIVREFQFKGLGLLLILGIVFSGCASAPQIKVSGNLEGLSENQVVAILPVETTEAGQKEAAALFRRGLHANLQQAKFQVMERYVVDTLLKNQGLNDPSEYMKISPMRLGEILGADAVILSKMKKVQRLYLVLHASIEVAVSAKMVDTRSGEVLWQADQTKTKYEGIAKIPTGLIAAGYGPLQFITNKVNLFKITKEIANDITALVKSPRQASEKEKFSQPEITVAALDEFDDVKNREKLQGYTNSQYAEIRKEEAVDPLLVASAVIEEGPDVLEAAPEPQFVSGPELQTQPSLKAEKYKPAVVARADLKELNKLAGTGPSAPHRVSGIENNTVPVEEESPFQPIVTRAEIENPEIIGKESVPPIEPEPLVHLAAYQVPDTKPFPAPYAEEMEPEPIVGSPEDVHEEAVEELTSPSAQFAKNNFYSIQVGAYKTKALAQAMVNKLASRGFSGFVSFFTKNGDFDFYKVRVQKFETRADAVKYAKNFMVRENIDYFITKIQLDATV